MLHLLDHPARSTGVPKYITGSQEKIRQKTMSRPCFGTRDLSITSQQSDPRELISIKCCFHTPQEAQNWMHATLCRKNGQKCTGRDSAISFRRLATELYTATSSFTNCYLGRDQHTVVQCTDLYDTIPCCKGGHCRSRNHPIHSLPT